MNWHPLKDSDDFKSWVEQSHIKPVVIFKHSPQCSLSGLIKSRIESSLLPDFTNLGYVDVIQHRSLSQLIESQLSERHESPQILILHHGDCVWAEDHLAIEPDEVLAMLKQLNSPIGQN